MGGNCSCLSKTSKEEENEFSVRKKPDPKLFLKKILKIQAFYRGYLARKKYYNMRLDSYNFKVCENLKSFAAQYLNSRFKKITPYVYNLEEDFKDPEFEKRQFRPATQIGNGGTYLGEWYLNILVKQYIIKIRIGSSRQGKGVQIWPDGSIYEGYWRDNQANIKGRLIHSDGDIYEGGWVNDKAEGYGTYLHVDGAKYAGAWKDDKQNGYGIILIILN